MASREFTFTKTVGKGSKKHKKTVTLKPDAFSLLTAKKGETYLVYVDILTYVKQGGSDPASRRDPEQVEMPVTLRVGMRSPDQFRDLEIEDAERAARARGYVVLDVLGFWRAPNPLPRGPE